MKKLLIFAWLIALAACTSSPRYTEQALRSMEAAKKYHSMIAGNWHYEKNSKKVKWVENFSFNEDDTFVKVLSGVSRDSVVVGGKSVWTDWTTFADDTLTGTWRIGWSEEYNSPYVMLNSKLKGGTVAEIKQFEFTDNGQFILNVNGRMSPMQKGLKEPDF